MMRVILGFATLMLAGVLSGCGGADSAENGTASPVAASTATLAATAPTEAATATPALTETQQSIPTLTIMPPQAPTASLATPENLDRAFEDSTETQSQREALVANQVEPRVQDERVLAAMRAVPRHSFVPTGSIERAYGDHPLPLGFGQTISQPSLVAMMTELLQLEAGEKVLEIGTGSGYQAAILAELNVEVYTVEIIPELAGIGRAVLDALGYNQVNMSRHDGYLGWEQHAPYDAIIVTAAPDHLPPPLVAQLNPDGGRMVIPIGPVGDVQTLWLVTREGEEVMLTQLLDVRFVPLTRSD